MKTTTETGQSKPHVALTIATGLGLGYLPKAPGTFGSFLGVVLTIFIAESSSSRNFPCGEGDWQLRYSWPPLYSPVVFLLVLLGAILTTSVLGMWAAGRVADHLNKKDPQIVVVDEVAGQLLTYVGLMSLDCFTIGWQSLLAGFILFRVFDIWKPFPARLAESFPGGIGIMADDWVAGVYAALVLAAARQLGL